MEMYKELKKNLMGKFFSSATTQLRPMFFFSLFISYLGSTIVLTMPFSFLPKMMRSFGIAENDIGYRAGIVSSSFYLGQAIGGCIWGYLCHRIGSKRSLLIGTMLLAIQTIFFGMSRSYEWAVVTRLIQGVVEGILVTAKSIVFLVCDATNNSIGLAALAGAYVIGSIIGPAIGGFLVYPCERYSNLCRANSFLVRYPFLLAALTGSSFLLVSLLLAFINIPDAKRSSVTENTSLLHNENQKDNIDGACSDKAASEDRNVSFVESHVSSDTTECCIDDKITKSYFQIENGTDRRWKCCVLSCYKWIQKSPVISILRMKQVMLGLSLYCITSFNAIGFEEIFPVFADSPLRYGGLNFTTKQIGTALLIAAAPLSILIFLSAKMAIWTYYVMIFCFPLFPYVAAVEARKIWFVLIPILLFYNYMINLSFFAGNMHMNVSAPLKLIGVVNGFAVTVSSTFRMASPAVLGSLFSWSLQPGNKYGYPFNHCLPFVVMGFVALIGSGFASFIRQRNDHKLKVQETDEDLDNDSREIKV